jgi:hypothetical protein
MLRRLFAVIVPAGVLFATSAGAPAQPAATTAADTSKPKTQSTKTARPRSRTEKASIAAVTANSIQVTTKEGTLDIALTPETTVLRQENDLLPNELKVGDAIAFPLRGTDDPPTVSSLVPLTLKYADIATLTLNKTEKMSFDRLTTIKSSDLATGQNVSVQMNVLADGKLEARRVTVMIDKPKPAKTPRTRKTAQ